MHIFRFNEMSEMITFDFIESIIEDIKCSYEFININKDNLKDKMLVKFGGIYSDAFALTINSELSEEDISIIKNAIKYLEETKGYTVCHSNYPLLMNHEKTHFTITQNKFRVLEDYSNTILFFKNKEYLFGEKALKSLDGTFEKEEIHINNKGITILDMETIQENFELEDYSEYLDEDNQIFLPFDFLISWEVYNISLSEYVFRNLIN